MPLAGGENSTTFELLVDDGSSLVLKLYSELLASELAKEAYIYQLLAGCRLPTATLVHSDDSRTILPLGYSVTTKLEGDLLMKVQPHLGDEKLFAIYSRIGALLARLHEVRLHAFGYLGADGIVDPKPTNLVYMQTQFEARLREFGELGGGERLRRRIADHVAEREDLFAGCEHACLCHDDCHEENLLIGGDGRITGVVDFGNATAADPLLDLAKTSLYSRWHSDARVDALAAGHDDLRDDWRDAFALYELYHRLELWWWFASTRQHLDALPRLEASLAAAAR